MEASNETWEAEFFLVGFPDIERFHLLLFSLLLFTYLLILGGNAAILMLIRANPHLHVPMYYFVAILSFLEVWYTTVTIPKMLANLLDSRKPISYRGCLLQVYFFHALGITEACLLTAMAYDRYLAICKPLHYPSAMTPKICLWLAAGCWACGFMWPVPEIILLSTLPLCGAHRIEHLFCDFPSLFSLACADVSTSTTIDFTLHSFVILGPATLILFSYVKILSVIIKIQGSEGRRKAFSTCASHLTVVLAFFGTTGFMYIRPAQSRPSYHDRVVAMVYAVLTPLFNPLIYSLRNKDIREAISNLMKPQWVSPVSKAEKGFRL
ncbi:olfactory receptor 6N1-like [Terrapene carolina triunguis]|uniref:Olfactory receptor n=1 Tax=Terrapene triunguis TaxID=2587831 RepID=A0A674J6Z4_9SAUR|nr:olfactory receptor 6N1-like [Terrapene carolina triunguis]